MSDGGGAPLDPPECEMDSGGHTEKTLVQNPQPEQTHIRTYENGDGGHDGDDVEPGDTKSSQLEDSCDMETNDKPCDTSVVNGMGDAEICESDGLVIEMMENDTAVEDVESRNDGDEDVCVESGENDASGMTSGSSENLEQSGDACLPPADVDMSAPEDGTGENDVSGICVTSGSSENLVQSEDASLPPTDVDMGAPEDGTDLQESDTEQPCDPGHLSLQQCPSELEPSLQNIDSAETQEGNDVRLDDDHLNEGTAHTDESGDTENASHCELNTPVDVETTSRDGQDAEQCDNGDARGDDGNDNHKLSGTTETNGATESITDGPASLSEPDVLYTESPTGADTLASCEHLESENSNTESPTHQEHTLVESESASRDDSASETDSDGIASGTDDKHSLSVSGTGDTEQDSSHSDRNIAELDSVGIETNTSSQLGQSDEPVPSQSDNPEMSTSAASLEQVTESVSVIVERTDADDHEQNTDKPAVLLSLPEHSTTPPAPNSLPVESEHKDSSVIPLSNESSDKAQLLPSSKDSDFTASTSSIASLSTISPSKSSVNSEDSRLLSELDVELGNSADSVQGTEAEILPNGLKGSLAGLPELRELKGQHDMLQKTLLLQQEEIQRLKEEVKVKSAELETSSSQCEKLKHQVQLHESNTKDDIYEAQIKELEVTIVDQKDELKVAQDALAAHDTAAKKAITSLQAELKTRVEQLTKTYEDCRREKDSMVVKFAQAESRTLEMQGHMGKMQMQMKEMCKEKEMMLNRFRNLKSDKQKAVDAYEARSQELNSMRREMEKNKDSAHSAQVSVKWAQNKLKVETDNHKETKWRLEEANHKLKTAREETEMIRRDCQAMIKTYQESEEIKSNTLDMKLKETQEELQQHQQEQSDQQEVHSIIRRELETLKNKHKEMIEELKTWKDKVRCLDAERLHQEETLTRFKDTLQSQKNENADLRQRLDDLEDVEKELAEQKATIECLQSELTELSQIKEDLQRDIEGCSEREIDHLEYTQKMSETNAKLISDNTALNAKVKGLAAEGERLTESCDKLKAQNEKLSKDLAEMTSLRKEETESLSSRLADKIKIVEDLSLKVEEEKDEIKTLKRKHTANTKDLTRQLQQAKKRLEAMDNKDATSMGSRTSSSNSLDTINAQHNHRSSSHDTTPQEDCPPIVEVVEVDKQMLVEKIVRLQRTHARKNEKIEFMEDHVNQLLAEVKKKNKIIQSYVMREESGTLTPNTMDANKAQMAKKMGIMASMYSHHQKDGEMTLDLSLEINHKLQGVLEDTLLKNITLKENLDTLGREIAHLSQENRQLQLRLSDITGS